MWPNSGWENVIYNFSSPNPSGVLQDHMFCRQHGLFIPKNLWCKKHLSLYLVMWKSVYFKEFTPCSGNVGELGQQDLITAGDGDPQELSSSLHICTQDKPCSFDNQKTVAELQA